MWFEKAFVARSGMLKDATEDEYFNLLRDDHRYDDLVRRRDCRSDLERGDLSPQ